MANMIEVLPETVSILTCQETVSLRFSMLIIAGVVVCLVF